MSAQSIRIDPDPILHQRAEPVRSGWPGLPGLVTDLIDTLAASGGIGLAAPQIGELHRVVLIDLSPVLAPPAQFQPLILVNPMLSHGLGTASIEEGCLSVPDICVRVPRYASVSIAALDAHGQALCFRATGLLAICIQHELDHLDGRLMTDPSESA